MAHRRNHFRNITSFWMFRLTTFAERYCCIFLFPGPWAPVPASWPLYRRARNSRPSHGVHSRTAGYKVKFECIFFVFEGNLLRVGSFLTLIIITSLNMPKMPFPGGGGWEWEGIPPPPKTDGAPSPPKIICLNHDTLPSLPPLLFYPWT